MNIKILIAIHKTYWTATDSVYLPMHIGKNNINSSIALTGDNTGDNISDRNANYCELTALYWAWKNLEADYIGLVHYRRYFTRKEVRNNKKKRDQILTSLEWCSLLTKEPIVVPNKRRYYIETNRSHFNHAHHKESLNLLESVIQKFYPEYLIAFEKVMQRSWAHMFNMFAMRRDFCDAYCQWLFDVLFKLENLLDISSYNTYESRIYGFLSELLLDVWLGKNQLRYFEQNVSFMEEQNWVKKGSLFLKRKIMGNGFE